MSATSDVLTVAPVDTTTADSDYFHKIMLWTSHLFILAMVIELGVFRHAVYPDSVGHQIVRFVVATFFFNFFHDIMTFVLFLLPESKMWLKESFRKSPVGLPLMAGGIFFTSAIVMLSLEGTIAKPAALVAPYIHFFFVLFIPTHHALSQIRGISLLYNRQAQEQTRDHERLRELEKSERFHMLLFFLSIAGRSALYVPHWKIDAQTVWWTNVVMTLVAAGSFVMLIVVAHQVNKIKKTAKLQFMSRLALFIMFPFSYAAFVGATAIHGIEYLYIYSKMQRNSSMKQKQRQRFMMITVVSLIVAVVLMTIRRRDGLYFLFWDDWSSVPLGVQILAAMTVALGYLHFYIDRRMFRMREPINRRLVLPLLAEQKVR